VPKKQCEVEALVRGAHDQINVGLMRLNADQLLDGLAWNQANYGKLDVEQFSEMALDLHEKKDQ
tara:strand:- start:224 stop:415 length:192 start_codon:yes stop_codon:yes gene_type:complete